MKNIIEKAKNIRCLISDVDGVLTNGLLYMDESGKEFKAYHVQDGMGLKMLMAAGIDVAIITTSVSTLVAHRMKQLGINLLYTGQVEKESAFIDIKNRLGLTDDQFAYIGDDLPDLSVIQQVGLGVAVANAVPQVREFADWITLKSGGDGAVRELSDLILAAQNRLDSALQTYLKS
jgi:3-deoxy-D-manno-octulosonate 8-phosphate phosphatase (KDO 8-P phosphatase)